MATPFPERPDYFTLRLAADLSSAIRGEPVWFDYTADTGLQITGPAGGSGASPPIPVSTPLSAKGRPTVDSVTVAVDCTVEIDGKQQHVDYGTLQLPYPCSALFWSESAVEKFLLPYYVSAGGQQAYQVLHAINHAWYAYQGDTPVVALAFGYPSQPYTVDSVQLWDTVWVISCQGPGVTPAPGATAGPQGSLVMQPLREFLTSQPPPQLPEALDNPRFAWGAQAAPSTPATPIDSVGAREVAEYVSGLRERIVNVYQTDGDGGLEPTLTPIGTGQPLFTAWTRAVRPARPTVTVSMQVTTLLWNVQKTTTKVLAGIGGDQAPNLPDSAFWTDGAVEKLVLPYYASVEGRGAPWYLMLILGKWSGIIPTSLLDAVLLLAQIVEALGKVLLENPAGIVGRIAERLEGETETTAATGPVTSDAYALVHLPNSEWVDQQELFIQPLFLENRTWFLTSDGDHPLVAPGRRLVPLRRVTA